MLEDVRSYIHKLQRLAATARGAGAAPAKPAPEQVDFSKWGPIYKKPLSPLREVIARRMTESWTTTPRVTQFDEADITALLGLRKKYAAAYEQKGARLTLTSFALKVVVDTLKKHPIFNASLDEVAQEIVFKEYYHIGVAVDTDAGLIVPVIRDADKKDVVDAVPGVGRAGRQGARAQGVDRGTQRRHVHHLQPGRHRRRAISPRSSTSREVAILGLGRGATQGRRARHTRSNRG